MRDETMTTGARASPVRHVMRLRGVPTPRARTPEAAATRRRSIGKCLAMYRAPEQRGVPVIGVGLGPCGCQKVVARHATVILVEEPAEAVVSFDLVDLGCCATGEWPCCVSPAGSRRSSPAALLVEVIVQSRQGDVGEQRDKIAPCGVRAGVSSLVPS